MTSGDTGERVYCSLASPSEGAVGAAARGARRSGAPLLGRPIGDLVDEARGLQGLNMGSAGFEHAECYVVVMRKMCSVCL